MRWIASLLTRTVDEFVSEPGAQSPALVGIVFVHGIGSQTQSATVREFSTPLLDYLREWHRTRGHPSWQPDAAEFSYGGTLEGPARVHLRWPAYRHGGTTWDERRFIFAEAWWATRLEAPTLDVMVGWSGRVLWGVIGTLWRQMATRIRFLVTRGGRSRSDPGRLAAAVEIASAFVFMLAYLVAAIAGYAVLIPLFVLARIPIQEVQEFILVKALKPFLVENIGDFETYMHDEIQALNIRTAVGETIRYLVKAGCDDVCVVAHSQGALVAFDGVCALARDDPETAAHVRKLITFGGALNRGFAQREFPPRLKQTLPAHVFWLDVWSQYDPVAGGYLRRRGVATALVAPSDELRQRMHWNAGFDGPMPDQVTNGMNPVVDHGGYFHNPEQFANRVLAEIDDPRAYYKSSRFFFHDSDPTSVEADPERVRRRRTRISTLALWRLIAIGAVAMALVLRGAARIADDGRALRDLIATVPLHELITAPGKFFDGVGLVLDAIGRALEQTGLLTGVIADVRHSWSAVPWADLVLATLAVAVLFAGVYWVLRWALYRPWDEREARDSIAETLPAEALRGLLRWVRTAVVIGAFTFAVLAAAAR
jgi:hypothetical protein